MSADVQSPASSAPCMTKHSVYVVEDHPLMRKSLVATFEREPDLKVCGQAEDVAEALTAIIALQPDIVLTDVQLKSSSGLDLIRELHSQAPALPVIATTMFNVRANERLARAAGAIAFVSKDEGPESLIAAVRRVLHPSDRPGCN